jgi:hypothetical protein
MRHPIATEKAQQTVASSRQPSRPTSLEAPEPGERFLGPSGRIWTVQALTARGNRIVLTTPTPDGDSGATVDLLAIARMIPLPIATSSPDTPAATPGHRPARGCHSDATNDDPRTRAIPAGTP